MELFRQACIHRSYVDRPDGLSATAKAVAEGVLLSTSLQGNRKGPSAAVEEIVVVVPRPEGCMPLCTADNEAIEFVGDSLLGCVIALYLHERYPEADEGFLTRLRTRLVNNKSLGELATLIGFGKWIVLSRHVEQMCNGRKNLRILGSMLEAWVGAIYLDAVKKDAGTAFKKVQTWLITLFEKEIDFTSLIAEDNNFKDQLLRLYQARFHQPPKYKEVAIVGPLHDRTFTMGVLNPDGSVLVTATSRNKRVAEQEASRLALQLLGVEELSEE